MSRSFPPRAWLRRVRLLIHGRPPRIRLTPGDSLRTALLGPRTRIMRTVLSALGIGVGIAALTAITGVSASNQAELRATLDAMGANLLLVRPAEDSQQKTIPMQSSAPTMVSAVDGVTGSGTIESVDSDVHAYRNDLVPPGQTGDLTVLAASPSLLDAVKGRLADGRWFDEAGRSLPVTVLGATAAGRLGITTVGDRVWIGGEWHTVIGVLDPIELAPHIDKAVFVGDMWAAATLTSVPVDPESGSSARLLAIYVQAEDGRVDEVRQLLAPSASPSRPGDVTVASLSELGAARDVADDSLASLGVALAGVALLVGGIGIANTMVVAVLERRGEIGLRRALGARQGQVAMQFVLEAVVLAAGGGVAGAALGSLGVIGYAAWQDQISVVPVTAWAGGPLVAVAVGVVAGLYPALRAARLPPTEALRS